MLFLLCWAPDSLADSAAYVAVEEQIVFAAPTEAASQVAVLPRGGAVTVLGLRGGWFFISMEDGVTGYAPCRSLRPKSTDATATAPKYAALALSPTTGNWGTGNHFASREEAEQEALRLCAKEDCRILQWVGNGCLSLTASSLGDIGSAADLDYESALARALDDCGRHGWGCRQIKTVCTD